jgi:hypothetical protein
MTTADTPQAMVAMLAKAIAKSEAKAEACARDWSEFCGMIGVAVDTHEAVAEQLMEEREMVKQAKRLAAASRPRFDGSDDYFNTSATVPKDSA